MRVLLIEPASSDTEVIAWAPIGKAYLAAVVRRAGHEVQIIDQHLRHHSDERLHELAREFGPDVIGLGGRSLQWRDTKRLAKVMREWFPDALLVGGGVHLTCQPEDGVDHFDLVMTGEGEENFVDLVSRFQETRSRDPATFVGVRSLVWRNRLGAIARTEERNLVVDLEALPLPAYDLLDVMAYNDFFVTGERAICVMTGRGCPYSCTFCSQPTLTKRRVRDFSIDYSFRLIEHFVETYGFTNIRIFDDTFCASKKRVLSFCDEMKRRQWKLNLTCLTHVQTVDEEVLSALKGAGFSQVAFGIESGNDGVLKLLNKRITKAQAARAVKMARDAGLFVEALFIIGNVGDTAETMEETVDFALEHNPMLDSHGKQVGLNWFQYATPWPGSQFSRDWRQYGTCVSEELEDYCHSRPFFVPKGTDERTMIEMRERGLAGRAATGKVRVESLEWD